MSIFGRLLGLDARPQPEASAWTNPAWWDGNLAGSVAGVAVSQDTALKISTVYACVSLISETIASLPLVMYRYMENEGGRERARNHPLYDVLHRQPNEQQTSFEFLQMMTANALMRGSGYAKIMAGPRGFVDQLIPLHPDQVQKERLQNGRIRYRVTETSGQVRDYLQDEIFEVGGLSLDGLETLSVVAYARDSFGLTLAAERFGSRFFRNDSRPGGVLRTDGKLTKEAAARLKASWEAAHSGGNQWRVAVLENGLQWQAIGISPEEAQFLQSREHQAEDVCRWFRVPPHMVGLTSKQTSWGSGIEQMSIGFVTYTLRPWLERWKQAIARDLIIAPQLYFADFVVEGLLRGDVETRYNAYATARQWGWMSINEIRRLENMNPVANGDAYLQPMNMEPAAEQLPMVNGQSPMVNEAHYRLLAEEAAARLVRKELAAVYGVGKKFGGAEYTEAVAEFYEKHIALVAQTMQMPLGKAAAYCHGQRDTVLTNGIDSLDERDAVTALADMALSVGGWQDWMVSDE